MAGSNNTKRLDDLLDRIPLMRASAKAVQQQQRSGEAQPPTPIEGQGCRCSYPSGRIPSEPCRMGFCVLRCSAQLQRGGGATSMAKHWRQWKASKSLTPGSVWTRATWTCGRPCCTRCDSKTLGASAGLLRMRC